MLTDAPALASRCEIRRPGIVHQQEGRHFLGNVVVGKNALDGETITDPMTAVAAFDKGDFFHDDAPLFDPSAPMAKPPSVTG
jgi:hypothetical protein